MAKKRMMVVALLFVVLVMLRMYVSSYEGFQSGGAGAGGAGRTTLVIAKADWCGHCRKAAPEFAKLKQASPLKLRNGQTVIVEELDADKDKEAVGALGVKGFPTLMIVKPGGERVEYPGERTYDAVVAFLEEGK